MNVLAILSVPILALALTASPSANAILLTMSDSFQDGATAGWSDGPLNPVSAVVVASGGPQGAGDRYLIVTSSGVPGPGGKLVAMNASQWSGDYIEAGVTAVRMDVNNLGATDLSLRLLFEAPAVLRAFSSEPIALPSGSGWQTIQFAVAPTALTGPAPAVALADVSQLRLYHGTSPAYPGEDIVAQLGLDNITPIPEPDAWALLGIGFAVVLVRMKRRTNQ